MRNYSIGSYLLTLLLLFGCVTISAMGQGGTGREPTAPPPKKTTTKKKAPPRNNPSTSPQAPCSAHSPTQATGRKHAVNLGGEVSLEMVEIPTGSFCMGSNDGNADEKPVHQVTINYSFYIGKYEVTQVQWQAVIGNNPSNFKGDFGEPYFKLPVEQVSWDDAQSFIKKLNERNDGFTYRLPTEAEWEYACRAGTTGDYAGNLSEMAWYSENSENRTHTVGQKQPNAWGLFDMHGNVYEWCQDWHHDSYNGAPTDGSAWLGGVQLYRVLRGGSWTFNANYSRSAYRFRNPPDNRNSNFGFRVVTVPKIQ